RTTAALVSLALGGVALGTAEFASIGILPSVASSLSVSEPAAGLLISLLLALMALFGLAQVGSALAPNFPVLAATRFVAGLPHGAYLGVASLTAASLVPDERRGRAIAAVFLGLTIANVAGVPLTIVI